MKLRTRLAVTLAVLVVPFAVATAAYVTHVRDRLAMEGFARLVQDRMEHERALCEAAPHRWPMRRHRPRLRQRLGPLFPYDSTLRGTNPHAPRFGAPRRTEIRSRLAEEPVTRIRSARGRDDLVAVRMPWTDGPCAVLVTRRPVEPHAFRRAAVPAVVVSLGAVLLAVLAAGGIVRRIRKLTEEVRTGRTLSLGATDEIGELAQAFGAQRTALEHKVSELREQETTLRNFVANTTHDVMTPLTVLQGHLASFEDGLREGVPPEAAKLSAAIEEADYLGALLRNLAIAAKLEGRGRSIAADPIDLGALVERVASRFSSLARQKNVRIEHAVPDRRVSVTGDVTLLEQAVSNVVQNAIRYQEGGHVAVVLERACERFRLSVIDDGPGVEPRELARLTDRGFRGARGRLAQHDGMGLGLSIVREVAERHQMTLAIENRTEGGLRVTLTGAIWQPEPSDPLR